jgi:DNA polymerase V
MNYNGGNTTGFASPAGDNLEGRIDLAAMLDLSRPRRYPVRVEGEDAEIGAMITGLICTQV